MSSASPGTGLDVLDIPGGLAPRLRDIRARQVGLVRRTGAEIVLSGPPGLL